MLEQLDVLRRLLEEAGRRDRDAEGECAIAAAATIVSVAGSVPRPAGASMLVAADGAVYGSLTSGCLDGDVYAYCLEAMQTGRAITRTFDADPADPFAPGLTCGGVVHVLVQPIYSLLPGRIPLLERIGVAGNADSVSLIRRIDTNAFDAVVLADPAHVLPGMHESELTELIGTPAAARAAAERLAPMLARGGVETLRVVPDGSRADRDAEISLFVETRLPAPRCLIVGANDFGAALLRPVQALGYRATLCDPRAVFAAQARFEAADEIVTSWPHDYLEREIGAGSLDDRTVICELSHDPKFDVPVLVRALRTDAAYIGALGSRASHARRVTALLDAGIHADQLERLHAPIGLDIAAVTPAEVAVAITAEILATRRPGSTGRSLSTLAGPVHAPAGAFPMRHRAGMPAEPSR